MRGVCTGARVRVFGEECPCGVGGGREEGSLQQLRREGAAVSVGCWGGMLGGVLGGGAEGEDGGMAPLLVRAASRPVHLWH